MWVLDLGVYEEEEKINLLGDWVELRDWQK